MSGAQEEFWTRLGRAEASEGLEPTRAALYAMVLEVMAMAAVIPPTLRGGLVAASQRWYGGSVGAPPLEPFRIACWEYLDEKNPNSTTIGDKEDAAVRALICVLHDELEDPSMTLDFFATMVENYTNLGEPS